MLPQDPNQNPTPQPVVNPPVAPQQVQAPIIQPVVAPTLPQPNNPYNTTYSASSGSKNKFTIIAIIVGALLVLGGIGFGAMKLLKKDGGSQSNPGATSVKTQEAYSGLKEKTIEKKGKVGTTANLEDYEVTVSSVAARAKLMEYLPAQAGKEFVVAKVNIKNNSKKELKLFGQFSIKTKKGEIIMGSPVYKESLPNAITPGGSAEGSESFEVTIGTGEVIIFEYLDTDTFTRYRAEFTL